MTFDQILEIAARDLSAQDFIWEFGKQVEAVYRTLYQPEMFDQTPRIPGQITNELLKAKIKHQLDQDTQQVAALDEAKRIVAKRYGYPDFDTMARTVRSSGAQILAEKI